MGRNERTKELEDEISRLTQQPERRTNFSSIQQRQGRRTGNSRSVSVVEENDVPALLNEVQTRHEYISLLETLSNTPKAELLEPSSESLTSLISRSQALFPSLKSTSDATLDSSFLARSATIGTERSANLSKATQQFKMEKFLIGLQNFLSKNSDSNDNNNSDDDYNNSNESIDVGMRRVGRIAAKCRLTVHTCDWMSGPLQKPQIIRTRNTNIGSSSARSVLPPAKAARQLTVTDIVEQPDETSKYVHELYRKIRELAPIHFFPLIVNPESFAQSIENLFYLSFLVKEGKVGICFCETDDGIVEPIVELINADNGDNSGDEDADKRVDEKGGKKQLVIELTMDMWKEAIEAYGITRPIMPTRPPPNI